MSSAPVELLFDLSQAGVDIDDVWELVNGPNDYDAAVPTLVDWLANVDDRVSPNLRPRVEESLVRALIVPAARAAALPVLIDRFKLERATKEDEVRWAIGLALGTLADDSHYEELQALARNKAYGRDRQELMRAFGRSARSDASQLLVDLLADDDVVAHTVEALGQRRDPATRSAVEPLLAHPRPLVRREASKALKRIPVVEK